MKVISMDEKKEVELERESDAQEVKEILEAVRDTVPELIKGIVDALYSGQSAEEFGKQVANFYKSLVDAGMSKDQAFILTQQFMESRDVVGILKKVLSEGNWGKWKNENIEKEIEEHKEELKKEES